MSRPLKELLTEIDTLKKEVDAVRPLKPELEQRILQTFRLHWNYHSNAIEGNKLTAGETRSLLLDGLTAHGKRLRDHKDIEGHDRVISMLPDLVQRKVQLTEADIRGMHKMLLVEPYQVEAITQDGQKTLKWIKLGEYKSEPNQVTTPTGAVKPFTLPEDTPAKMGELMAWYRKQVADAQEHAVITAALAHHQFAFIHPFDDGNGRMARILMNLILMQFGFPPVVIKQEERDQYYAGLGKADVGETDEFVAFIAEKLIASLQLYLRGARGEELSEPDDLDKRYTLLVKKLEQISEPLVVSDEVVRQFVDVSLQPLLIRLVGQLSKFDKLFAQRSATINGMNRSFSLPQDPGMLHQVINDLKAAPRGHDLTIQFSWSYLKAKPLEHVGHSAYLKIEFNQLSYRVRSEHDQSGRTRLDIQHVYAEQLTEEECERITKKIEEDLLNEIETATQPKT